MNSAVNRPVVRTLLSALSCGAVALAAIGCAATGANEPDVAFTVPGTPTTTLASAKDKPCVAPVDVPEAEGKPVVEVPVGPPPTELAKIDITAGTGAEAKLGDNIKVQYVGIACSTGKQFDASWDRGEPAEFPLTEGGLIQGWIDGIPGMKVGGRRQLNIPGDLAYGTAGRAPEIAPDEPLIFVIDLVDIVPATDGSTPPTTPGSTPVTGEGPAPTVEGTDGGSTSTTAADGTSTTTAAP